MTIKMRVVSTVSTVKHFLYESVIHYINGNSIYTVSTETKKRVFCAAEPEPSILINRLPLSGPLEQLRSLSLGERFYQDFEVWQGKGSNPITNKSGFS